MGWAGYTRMSNAPERKTRMTYISRLHYLGQSRGPFPSRLQVPERRCCWWRGGESPEMGQGSLTGGELAPLIIVCY